MFKGKRTIYFWANPAILGSDGVNQLLQTFKDADIKDSMYVELHLKVKKKVVSVLFEDVLVLVSKKLGYKVEVIELEMDPKEIIKISKAFNISRNQQHIIRNLAEGFDKASEYGNQFMTFESKGIKFVGMNMKTPFLDILDMKKIKNLSKEDFKNYYKIIPTVPKNENDNLEIELFHCKIKKIANS